MQSFSSKLTDWFGPAASSAIGHALISMLAAATAAVTVPRIDVISEVFAKVLDFGGGILIGAVILMAAWLSLPPLRLASADAMRRRLSPTIGRGESKARSLLGT